MAKLENILTVHSEGERDGLSFSKLALPMDVIDIVASMRTIVVGGGRGDIRKHLRFAVEDGSMKLSLVLPSAIAAAWLPASTFAADMTAISKGQFSIVQDEKRARAYYAVRDSLREAGATTVKIGAEAADIPEFDAFPREAIVPDMWVESDGYVSAKINDLGGKSVANVHLETEEGQIITATSDKSYLSSFRENLLYKQVLAHVSYLYNVRTGERVRFRLVEFVDRKTRFDEDAFTREVSGRNGWSKVADPVAAIRKMRSANV
jgi:hypothetical protein